MTIYDDYLLEGFDDDAIKADNELERQERAMEKAIEIERDPDELGGAIATLADSEHAEALYQELSNLMQHGGEADDVQFLEAARGVYDTLGALCYAMGEREEDGL